MFQRIDLYRSHCETLCLIAHTALPANIAEQIFGESHLHTEEEYGRRTVFYGSIYRRDGNPHAVQAMVRKVNEGEYHVELDYFPQRMPPPPNDMSSVASLDRLLRDFPDEVDFTCTGDFRYPSDEGWESLIPLPSKLAQETPPFTHTESITFSRREQDKITLSLGIRITNNNDILHNARVRFRGRFSEAIASQALRFTRNLSKPYVQLISTKVE
ncbi:MAG: hypothetical protein MN733_20860 [Nitrososphaera sp.]|nr:hypothetical protein [Nitrososphaera sp.]